MKADRGAHSEAQISWKWSAERVGCVVSVCPQVVLLASRYILTLLAKETLAIYGFRQL